MTNDLDAFLYAVDEPCISAGNATVQETVSRTRVVWKHCRAACFNLTAMASFSRAPVAPVPFPERTRS